LEEARELEQLRAQGESAVAELFHCYRDKLLKLITLRLDRRILGKVDAEDILQDTFVESARRIQQFIDRPTVPFFVWLRQIATQVLIDTHRRYLGAQKRDARLEQNGLCGEADDTNPISLVGQLADSLTTPSQCLVRKETLASMRSAVEQLAEADREVLILRHLEELSNNEVALILGIDKYAASKRYLRALQRLRGVMLLD
jgi:RNA polymerase sigma-70 factor (ECF subfamily)